MKRNIKFALSIIAVLLVSVMAFAFDSSTGGNEGMTTLAAATPVALPIKNELAEKEMIKKFRHDNSWLNEIRSKNGWVNNDVIKIPKRGAAPNVLINNNVYPIVSNKRDDSHVTVSLNKYDTENTTVTDDELYALPYEKVSDVQVQHREELEDKTAEHALYSIAPSTASADVPILETTGEDDGTGRLKLTSADLIKYKKELDTRNVPKQGRILVLCPDHVADLLEEDRKFFAQYQNHKDGVISTNYYGFKIYEANYTPTYDDSLEKLPFESLTDGRTASISFHKRTTAKARGSVTRYARDAKQNPEYRESTVGFRLYFVCVAIQDLGQGAIVSGKA
jgi:hypothetical protein